MQNSGTNQDAVGGGVVRPKDGSKLCYLTNTTERSVCARVATMRPYVKLLCALVIITVYVNLHACVLVLYSFCLCLKIF